MNKIIITLMTTLIASTTFAAGSGGGFASPLDFCPQNVGSSSLRPTSGIKVTVPQAMQQLGLTLEDIVSPEEKQFLLDTQGSLDFALKTNLLTITLGACADGSKKSVEVFVRHQAETTLNLPRRKTANNLENEEIKSVTHPNGLVEITVEKLDLYIAMDFSQVSSLEITQGRAVPTLITLGSIQIETESLPTPGLLLPN